MDVEVAVAVWKRLQNLGVVSEALRIVPRYDMNPSQPVELSRDTDVCIVYYFPPYFDVFNEWGKALRTALAVRHEVAHAIYGPWHSEETIKHLSKGVISDEELLRIVQGILQNREARRTNAWNSFLSLLTTLGLIALFTSPVWVPILLNELSKTSDRTTTLNDPSTLTLEGTLRGLRGLTLKGLRVSFNH